MSFEFALGTPFHPYEQLMGVLPVASMEHIPTAYQVRILRSFTVIPR
jgi:5'-3' exoribonuclease 1